MLWNLLRSGCGGIVGWHKDCLFQTKGEGIAPWLPQEPASQCCANPASTSTGWTYFSCGLSWGEGCRSIRSEAHVFSTTVHLLLKLCTVLLTGRSDTMAGHKNAFVHYGQWWLQQPSPQDKAQENPVPPVLSWSSICIALTGWCQLWSNPRPILWIRQCITLLPCF